jgi:hypothetical protein
LAEVDTALNQLLEAARQMRTSSCRLVPTIIESFPSGQKAISAHVEDGNATQGTGGAGAPDTLVESLAPEFLRTSALNLAKRPMSREARLLSGCCQRLKSGLRNLR